MVNYKAIKKIGGKLRDGGKEEISVRSLFQLLRDETGSHREKTLRHYVEILASEGFITADRSSRVDLYMGSGVLKIIRNGDSLVHNAVKNEKKGGMTA